MYRKVYVRGVIVLTDCVNFANSWPLYRKMWISKCSFAYLADWSNIVSTDWIPLNDVTLSYKLCVQPIFCIRHSLIKSKICIHYQRTALIIFLHIIRNVNVTTNLEGCIHGKSWSPTKMNLCNKEGLSWNVLSVFAYTLPLFSIDKKLCYWPNYFGYPLQMIKWTYGHLMLLRLLYFLSPLQVFSLLQLFSGVTNQIRFTFYLWLFNTLFLFIRLSTFFFCCPSFQATVLHFLQQIYINLSHILIFSSYLLTPMPPLNSLQYSAWNVSNIYYNCISISYVYKTNV